MNEKNDQHDQEFDADQHHADAHAGFERNLVDGERLAGQGGECGAGVGEGVDANAEPGHAVAAGDADQAEGEDDDDAHGLHVLKHAKVKQDDDGDESPQQQDEFALGDEIGFAGLVDEFGDFAHGAMNRQVLEAHVDDHAEAKPEDTEENADHQQAMAVDGAVQKADRGKVREFKRGFASGFGSGLSEGGRCRR